MTQLLEIVLNSVTGQQDVEKFIKIAQEVGLLVIARVGPYIGAERDNVSIYNFYSKLNIVIT